MSSHIVLMSSSLTSTEGDICLAYVLGSLYITGVWLVRKISVIFSFAIGMECGPVNVMNLAQYNQTTVQNWHRMV